MDFQYAVLCIDLLEKNYFYIFYVNTSKLRNYSKVLFNLTRSHEQNLFDIIFT